MTEFRKRSEENRKKFDEKVRQSREEAEKRMEEARRISEERMAESRRKVEEHRRQSEEETIRKYQKKRDGREAGSPFNVFTVKRENNECRVVRLSTPGGVNVVRESGLVFTLMVDDIDFLTKKNDNAGSKFAYSSTESWGRFSEEVQKKSPDSPAGFEFARQYYKWDDPDGKTLVCSAEFYMSLISSKKRSYNSVACLFNVWLPQGRGGTSVVSRTPYHGLTLRLVDEMSTDGKYFCDADSRKNNETIPLKKGESLIKCRWMAYSADVDGKPVTVALCCWPQHNMYAYTRDTDTGKHPILSAGWVKEPVKEYTVGPGVSLNELAHFYHCIMLWDGRMASGAVERAYAQWIKDERDYLMDIRKADGNSVGSEAMMIPTVTPPKTIVPKSNR